MEFTTIIKKGTKNDPVFMVHRALGDLSAMSVCLSEEDDNLPVFQPYPEYIEQDQLDEFDCELITMECKFK